MSLLHNYLIYHHYIHLQHQGFLKSCSLIHFLLWQETIACFFRRKSQYLAKRYSNICKIWIKDRHHNFQYKSATKNCSIGLLAVSFSEAPPFFSEELHSHFSPVNVFLPAVIEVTMLQPDTETQLSRSVIISVGCTHQNAKQNCRTWVDTRNLLLQCLCKGFRVIAFFQSHSIRWTIFNFLQ